jgi:hypothetical protein
MEQLTDSSYLVVYDVKNFKQGTRLAIIRITENGLKVLPIKVDQWDAEGISSDLESVCRIPNKKNEFLIAESGNWQGKLGRIFHIQLDISTLKAEVLGSFKFPMLHQNDRGLTGDQYEAIHCLNYNNNEKIILLGERGGSTVNPTGILRWGVWNIPNNTLSTTPPSLKGIPVNAPGHWANPASKRSITDLHVDAQGAIWAAASEDDGDLGPFYSVIYQLGQLNPANSAIPFTVLDSLTVGVEIYGFKVEALSGAAKGIDCTHSFGTEDEDYGGVWRPVRVR